MSYAVDFKDVSTVGLESSPVAEALAGLRANACKSCRNHMEFGAAKATTNAQLYVQRTLKLQKRF